MGFCFRKSISLGKLFRIYVSKRGVGFSVGVPGFRISLGADKKIRKTVGIPGTGISYTETIGDLGGKKEVRTCPACGKRVGKTSNYCDRCGTKL
ncbi:DUF4236 domain-containing protein [Carboxydothermus ferrireducens]|uniref:DUF4236 domain-containing protein n=2 Tax=Carboxydothermus TaxID=129957 RepID=A0ABX2R9C0_9THEO|nr:DUF4236 domain-containing protein [Carboxydothermus ferrireducens]NYE57519.1 hypothetical protein [Carboxydothermus ferrireducens DSM 11255]